MDAFQQIYRPLNHKGIREQGIRCRKLKKNISRSIWLFLRNFSAFVKVLRLIMAAETYLEYGISIFAF